MHGKNIAILTNTLFIMISVISTGVAMEVSDVYNPNDIKCVSGEPDDPFANFQITGQNRLPMHTTIYGSYENERDAAQQKNQFTMNLNGLWKFNLYKTPKEVPQDFMDTDFDDTSWIDMQVPSNWQMNESVPDRAIYTRDCYIFDANPPLLPEKNPTGCYRQTFTLPESWLKRDIILKFEGVDSALRLWVNGDYIGYSEDSKLPAEFDVTKHVKAGLNTIAAEVRRFSTGSYLESQDVWHMSGIYRDVSLISRPKVRLRDWNIRTTFDKEYKNATLNATIYLETANLKPEPVGAAHFTDFSGYKAKLKLVDANNNVVFETEAIGFSGQTSMYGGNTERDGANFSVQVPSPKKWSPEHPNLYNLFIYLVSDTGAVQEIQCAKVGFRQVEIRDSQLLFNGKRMIVRGVNRHDITPYHGYAVTELEMRSAIMMMKKLNFNAVRTCHYPDSERWYELCDELGLAVIDETNLETHGLGAQLSVLPEWSGVYLERMQRMVLRDRNHPCVIVWSLGNESGCGGNHAAMSSWIHFFDPTRPVQYESGNPPATISDILCPMYPNLNWVKNSVSRNPSRPLIMCEYAYAMGNATGNFFKFWDLVHEYPSFQGGFIWDWADKALYGTCIADGQKHLAYGNDLGENFDYVHARDGQHPTQVLNGIVDATGKPHPGAEEVRVCQAPITFKLGTVTKDEKQRIAKIIVKNEYLDTNLNENTCKWTYTNDGKIVQEGSFQFNSTEPYASTEPEFKLDECDDGKEGFLNLYAFQGEQEITHAQFLITKGNGTEKQAKLFQQDSSLTVKDTADTLTVGIYTWSKKTGKLISIIVNGKEQLDAPVEQIFYRAPTSNDKTLDKGGTFAKDWSPLYHPQEKLIDFQWDKGNNALTVKSMVHCITTMVVWKIGKNNGLSFEQIISFDNRDLHSIARVGMMFPLKEKLYTDVKYYGLGPHENYWDRQNAALVGTYNTNISDMLSNYLIPSECGSRGSVRSLNVHGPQSEMQVINTDVPFRFSALHYSPLTLKDTTHDWQLKPSDKTWVILDGFHMGLGGDDGWTPANVHPEFVLRPNTYRWGAFLRFSSK